MNATNPLGRSNGGRSPDELQRDGDAIRAHMDRTLEALERKFSPRELADRSATYLREHSSQLVDEIGDTMRRHPVTLLLTAAGIAWLGTAIVRERRGTSSNGYHDATDAQVSRDNDVSWSRGDGQQSQAGYETPRGTWQRARRRARTTASNMRGRVGATVDSALDRIADTRGQIGNLVQEQPLVVGLLAAAAGALIGAALPVSEPERRLLQNADRVVRGGTGRRTATSATSSDASSASSSGRSDHSNASEAQPHPQDGLPEG
jgi:ElaB/YqjD/DUF883 family membrane-anchored ribosome-binding protein